MALELSSLRALGGGGGFWLWHYRTSDGPDRLLGPDYFRGHDGVLRAGHMILAACNLNASPMGLVLFVSAADGEKAEITLLSREPLEGTVVVETPITGPRGSRTGQTRDGGIGRSGGI